MPSPSPSPRSAIDGPASAAGRRAPRGRARARVAAPLGALAVAALAAATGQGALLWLEVPVAVLAAATGGSARLRGLSRGAPAAVCVALPLAEGSPPPLLGLAILGLSVAAAVRGVGRLEAERSTLRSQARVDALTGVGNVRLLHERLGYEVARHSRHGRRLALVTLDLDGFKAVNDRFGHPAGDELLRDVARELVRAVRAEDTVVRQGGDEFCVVAPEAGPAQAQRLAERLAVAVARAGAGLERLSASVGYAVFPDDARGADTLIARADEAQGLAKRERARAAASAPRRRQAA